MLTGLPSEPQPPVTYSFPPTNAATGFSRAVFMAAIGVHDPAAGSYTKPVLRMLMPSVPPTEYSLPASSATALSMMGCG